MCMHFVCDGVTDNHCRIVVVQIYLVVIFVFVAYAST